MPKQLKRNWMKITPHPEKLEAVFTAVPITIESANALAPLMDCAYQGTIDHEGESLNQCAQEMRDTISGKYGPYIQGASFMIYEGNRAVSASMVTLWEGHPLLAYSMTDPAYQGKGMAKFLIQKSIHALYELKYDVFTLVVTSGNIPAEKLYLKLGFQYAGEAVKGTRIVL